MTKQIEITRKTRSFLLENLKDLTTDQFNKIPEGYNNNIIWNLAHLISAQQGVCYVRAGLPTVVSEEFWNKYKTGTKPEQPFSPEEIESIKNLLVTTVDQLETDYSNQIFGGYVAWVPRYGFELASIDDALNFLPFHEGLHAGYITALKKLV